MINIGWSIECMVEILTNIEISKALKDNDVKVLESVLSNLSQYHKQFESLDVDELFFEMIFIINKPKNDSFRMLLSIFSDYFSDFSKVFNIVLESRNGDHIKTMLDYIKDIKVPYDRYKGVQKVSYPGGVEISLAFRSILKYSFNNLAWLLGEMNEDYNKEDSKKVLNMILENRMHPSNLYKLISELKESKPNLKDFSSPIGKLVHSMSSDNFYFENGITLTLKLNNSAYDSLWLRVIEIEELSKLLSDNTLVNKKAIKI